MDLTFLGNGAAFNPQFGNTSAYFKEKNTLFLIDCGESIFAKLIEDDLLSDITDVRITITHTHPDHIGSLGSLIMYCYFQKGFCPTVIGSGNQPKHLETIRQILSLMGVPEQLYKTKNDNSVKSQIFNSMEYIPTSHSNWLKSSYGIKFKTNNGIIYYSGDTVEIEPILTVLKGEELVDKIYLDITTAEYKGNIHLPLRIAMEQIPLEQRNKIICMHFNNEECVVLASKAGFGVAIPKSQKSAKEKAKAFQDKKPPI